jgi:nucleotide-binding universal stress UspA family protein
VKRILILVDGSARSLDAVRVVTKEGSAAIERIDLINVQPLFNRHVSRWLTREQRDGWRRERSRKALAFARKIVGMGGIPCEVHAATGAFAPAIAEAARHLRSHEIVVASRQRTRLGRLLANSASARLLEVSSIPVRVIPAAPAPLLESLALPAGLGLAALLLFVAD